MDNARKILETNRVFSLFLLVGVYSHVRGSFCSIGSQMRWWWTKIAKTIFRAIKLVCTLYTAAGTFLCSWFNRFNRFTGPQKQPFFSFND